MEPAFSIGVLMQMVVSIVLLAAALFVILSQWYDARAKHSAYGIVGVIAGFWLKP